MECVCDTGSGDFTGDTNHHDPDAVDEDGKWKADEENNPSAPSRAIREVRKRAAKCQQCQEELEPGAWDINIESVVVHVDEVAILSWMKHR
jgi:hypothetical protein